MTRHTDPSVKDSDRANAGPTDAPSRTITIGTAKIRANVAQYQPSAAAARAT